MSPYRIAPAAAAPPPKRSAVVRLWRVGRRLDPMTEALMPVVGLLMCSAAAIVVGVLANDMAPGFAAGYAVFTMTSPRLASGPPNLRRESVARLTRYQATTETRERARYASGATAAVAEARDRRKRPCHVCGEVDRCDAGLHS